MNVFWLLTIVPELVFHLVLAAGLIGLFVAVFIKAIPIVNQYKLPIQIVSLILVVFGVYFQGALGYKQSVAVEVAELKQKLAEAEAKSAQTNTEIVEKIVKDTEVIREKGKTITEYIDREVVKYDDSCVLPKEVIDAHNAAATMDLSKLDGEVK